MPSSPIRKLTPFAESAEKKGIHIYHLNIGQPDIATPANFWEAIQKINLQVLAYSPSSGYDYIREKYAAYFADKCGLTNINARDLLITTGASEALLFTMLSLFDEGDELIVPEPLYANYVGYAKSASVQSVAVTAFIDNGFALPPIEEFEKKITAKTKAILICNPSNPTGYIYSLEELKKLRDIAIKHDLFIISDEVYRVFNYTDTPHISMMSFPEIEQHVILIDSLSKKFSACGARIGTVVSKNKEVLQTILKYAQQRLSPPTVEQIGSNAMFDVEDSYFEEVKAEYIHRRNVLVSGLNQIEGVKCPTPTGAFYCMVELPVKDSEHFCQWMLESFSYEQSTVMMAPGSGFYATAGLGTNQVRMAYVLQAPDLEKAVKCLDEGLKAYKFTHPEKCKKI